jgi:hypothetical protein
MKSHVVDVYGKVDSLYAAFEFKKNNAVQETGMD